MIIKKPKNFNLDQIYASGQCFRWKERPSGGYYMPSGHGNNKIVIAENETRLFVGCSAEHYKNIFDYFDLGTNYLEIETEVYHTHDKYLIKCYEHGKGIRILRQDLWETLITFIISQNNNIPRIKKSVEKICNGSHFPTPQELIEMDLSDKGLGYRERYVKDACKHFMNPRFVELLYKKTMKS